LGVLTRCSLYLFINYRWLKPTAIDKKDAAAIVNALQLFKERINYILKNISQKKAAPIGSGFL
jgi:hypothetical protein